MTEEPWASDWAGALELVRLPPAVPDALADGDLAAARAVTAAGATRGAPS
ncbi:hypothetical protein [Arthrobacter sp. PAMC25564]|nr:hypothetical protein [Arthrobacter sp. PAMC25564]